jgi:hypothetical protein
LAGNRARGSDRSWTRLCYRAALLASDPRTCRACCRGAYGIQRSRSTEASLSINQPRVVREIQRVVLVFASPVSPLRRGGPGHGRGSDMARVLPPRGAAPPPDLEKYSPRSPPFAAADQACRPHRPHSRLAGHCYRRSSRRQSRVEAKCILVAAGGRSLSSDSSGPAVCETVCGLPDAGCA